MKNLIIYHDKFLEYGGAEVVLESLVSKLKPRIIYTTCLANRPFWEDLYQTKIISPWIFSFIKTQRIYRILYPFICLLAPFCKPKVDFKYNALVYSSTSAKFLSTASASNIMLYSNFPAKPLLKFKDYFAKSNLKSFLFIVNPALFFWTFIELLALNKFNRIAVISGVTMDAYKSLFGKKLIGKLEVVYCPVKDSIFNFHQMSPKLCSDFFKCIIISRLYPEKNLEPLISFIATQKLISLTVVGDGPLYELFIAMYGQQVTFTGFVDDATKLSLISQSDFLLQPTDQEWSLVTIEANILGVPVISILSDAVLEINHSVGGNDSLPNMTYSRFEDIPMLLNTINDGKNLLRRLDANYYANFSVDSCVKNLNFHLFHEK